MTVTNTIKQWRSGSLAVYEIDGVPQPLTDEPEPVFKLLFPKAAPILPIPRNNWPMWAKAIAQFAKPKDKGVGDVTARIIGNEKSEAFKAWHRATFGRECGCTGRHRLWNRQYPLTEKLKAEIT